MLFDIAWRNHITTAMEVSHSMRVGRLAFNPPSDNVQSPLASWHHPFDAACLGTDFVQQQACLPPSFRSVHAAAMEPKPSAWLGRRASILRLSSALDLTGQTAFPVDLASVQHLSAQGFLQASPYIDFMSVHMYPDSWLVCSDECKLDWAQRWVRAECLSLASSGSPRLFRICAC